MNKLKLLLVLGAVLAVSGCVTPVPNAESLDDTRDGSVIIVGRVVLNPPLDDKDQILDTIGSGAQRKQIYLNVTPKLVNEDAAPMIGPEFIQDTEGQFFFVKRAPQPTYVQDMTLYLSVKDNRIDYAKLPGGLKVEMHKGDRAIYIGTMRFTRNEYWDITKAQLLDEYAAANAAFKKKFHAHYNLRNAMASIVSVPKK